MKYIIDIFYKETGLPMDYLEKEQELMKKHKSTTRTDCTHFTHWNLTNQAYSECTHYHNWFILMDKDCCKDCQFYESRLM